MFRCYLGACVVLVILYAVSLLSFGLGATFALILSALQSAISGESR